MRWDGGEILKIMDFPNTSKFNGIMTDAYCQSKVNINIYIAEVSVVP